MFTFQPDASFQEKLLAAQDYKAAVDKALSGISTASMCQGISADSATALAKCSDELQSVAAEAEDAVERAGMSPDQGGN